MILGKQQTSVNLQIPTEIYWTDAKRQTINASLLSPVIVSPDDRGYNRGPMEFLAAIFDLDGTLLDTLADIADAMNAALETMGFPGHETSAYKYLTGDGVRALAERSLPEPARDEATVAACIRELRMEYADRWGRKTRPYPGIPELLSAIARRKVRMNILSNKLDEFTRRAAEDFLPGFEFDFVIGAKPDHPSKPDPSGALFIAGRLEIEPARFVYLGDTGVDMLTAAGAGMFPVGALWGFRDEEELTENGAKAIIRSPAELLEFFD
jgi:phosphoglycolate phosphatase